MVLFYRLFLELLVGAAIEGDDERAAVADVQATLACPNCGRVNSVHTRVCPRCEARLIVNADPVEYDNNSGEFP